MGAYNELIISAPCPACAAEAELCFQVHSRASFDGDETGRFSQRTYRLGDRLAWWSDVDPRRARAEAGTDVFDNGRDGAEESYGVCRACHAALVATVVIRDGCLVDATQLRVDLD